MPFQSYAADFSATLSHDSQVAFSYLRENAVGWAKAKTWPEIEEYLHRQGIRMTKNSFQASVVKPSREGKAFLGSTDAGIRGYFIIASPEDAAVMRAWYKKRIAKEQANLDNLNALVKEEWNI
jgi:hypothetical protein